jgi:signal transduction histidine kinase
MGKDLTKLTKYDKLIEASTWLIIVALIFGIQFMPNKLLGGDQSFVFISAIIVFALIYYLIIYRYFSKSSRVYLKNIADIVLIGVLIFSMKDYGQYFFALYFIPIAAAALSLEFANALLIAVVACLFVVLEMLLGSRGYYPESMRVYQGVWQIGLILFITIFCRFLANQIRQEKTLKEEAEAREKALKEEAEKEKEFISLTSHQLYTPISIIRGFSSMLENDSLGKLTEKQKDAVGKIYNNSKRMVSLISELLAVSRIQNETFKIKPEKTDISKIATEVISEINQTKNKDSVKLETEFEHLEPVFLDPDKIRQVFYNLISNAIKYTQTGRIVLKITQDEKNTNFSIIDEGAGIREEDKDKIFQPFFRGKNILELDNKGTGLGLYISKMIVEGSGGKISFTSKEKEGTTFYFNLPRKNE